METTAHLFSPKLSTAEHERLYPALAGRYQNSNGISGSELGLFIRRHLENPDLKGRFGGLKSFISQYFPSQIVWSGRKGLDDLYNISFSTDNIKGPQEPWLVVPYEPSATLWSAVTNPSVPVQFALSTKDDCLLQAWPGTSVGEFTSVEKLSRWDYQTIGAEFMSNLENVTSQDRESAMQSLASISQFTRVLRQLGYLVAWEEFRVEQAIRLFGNRIGQAGARTETVTRWIEVLRKSHELARVQRERKPSLAPARQNSRLQRRNTALKGSPSARAVAKETMDFLSDSEIEELRLPLRSIMLALKSLAAQA